MPSLHVIYDPNDKISHDADLTKRLGLKVAILSTAADLSNDEIAQIAMDLVTKLMEQVRIDD